MRRLFLPVFALSLAATPMAVEAQAHRGPMGAPGARAGDMNPAGRVLEHREALGLSLDQVRQLQQIQERVRQQNEPLLEQARSGALRQHVQRATPEQREQMQQRRGQVTAEQREQMRQQMQQRRGQVTPEQREQMRQQMQQRRGQVTPEQREQMRQQMQQRREQVTPEQREQMRQQMQQRREQVTPEQREQVRQQMEQRRAAMLERVQDPALRQQLEERRAVMEQLQANQRQARADVEAVLTTQQREQLRQLQQQRIEQVRGQFQGRERPAGAAGRTLRRGR